MKLGAISAFLVALTGLLGQVTGAWEALFGGDPDVTTSTTEAVTTTFDRSTTTSGETTTSQERTSTSVDGEACTVTVSNPFASISVDPDPFSQEIRTVTAGTYEVLESQLISFAGGEQRWIRIEVGGDQGWIEFNTILIDSSSPACEF